MKTLAAPSFNMLAGNLIFCNTLKWKVWTPTHGASVVPSVVTKSGLSKEWMPFVS